MTNVNSNAVFSRAEVEAIFGRFAYTVNSDRTLAIKGSWVEDNITTVLIPQLVGIPTYGGKFSGRVRFHRKGVEQLQRAFADAEAGGVMKYVKFWDGSFFPRLMVGSSGVSRHSWGTAFDINATWNPFGKAPAKVGSAGDVHPLVPFFQKNGFSWGGAWGTPDGMHFEVNRIMTYTDEKPEGPLLVINDDTNRTLECYLKDNLTYASRLKVAAIAHLPVTEGEADRDIPVAQYLRANGFVVSWHEELGEHGKVFAYKNGA